MRKYTEFERIGVKDVKVLLNVSYTSAGKYLNDIKDTYNIETVLYHHFLKYFRIEK